MYKPYSKKGLSEKLLHRFSGPYIVVRQSSSLNYIVKRQGQDKTIKVHVSTLKPFVDRDYDEILSDEETDQPIDGADPETRHPESFPTQPDEHPLQQETPRTEPERKRKKKSKPSQPTTEAVKQAPMVEPRADGKPQRTRRLPKKLLPIVPLLILSILVPPATPALVNDIIQRDGVVKQITQVAMGDSAWTVVTNVNFYRINAMIQDMSNQLTVRKTYNVTSGIAFVKHLSKRLDTGLTANDQRLNTVKT